MKPYFMCEHVVGNLRHHGFRNKDFEVDALEGGVDKRMWTMLMREDADIYHCWPCSGRAFEAPWLGPED